MSTPEASLPSEHVNDASPPSDILTEAREAAREDRNYDSAAVRRVIEDQFRAIYDNNKPYDWQLDVAEALILGQDCIAIAGTGSGKTMPFGMPLMHPEFQDRIVLVLSPLNELEAEQVRILPLLHRLKHILMLFRLNDSTK